MSVSLCRPGYKDSAIRKYLSYFILQISKVWPGQFKVEKYSVHRLNLYTTVESQWANIEGLISTRTGGLKREFGNFSRLVG